MAQSPAHKFGQLIGELLESILLPELESFSLTQGLYLDYQKKKRPARNGNKVSWADPYGNIHDLDFVLERDGSDLCIGRPVAFIESAWRRYTKHSRNKAQEIQGAILPLAEKYKWNNPFLGAVLAGVFTDGALEQLQSLGFNVLYLPYETFIKAFQSEAIDIAFDESTPDDAYEETTNSILDLHPETIGRIKQQIIETNQNSFDNFFISLKKRLSRFISSVIVIPLYGHSTEFDTIDDAISFLDKHSVYEGSGEFQKYEIHVLFSNGDRVDASLVAKEKVREFLEFVALQ